METKANYVLVGAFTLIVIILAILLFAILGQKFKHAGSEPLHIYIRGSASGLSEGACVLFNGIRVGEIKTIELDPHNPNRVLLKAFVAKDTPITRSTKAMLMSQGVTGVLHVELLGGDISEASLLEEARAQHKVATLEASSASLGNLMAAAQDIASSVTSVASQAEQLLKDIRAPLTQTIANLHQLSSNLADNQNIIGEAYDTIRNVKQLTGRINEVMTKLDSSFVGQGKDNIFAKLRNIVDNIYNSANQLNKHIAPIVQNIETLSGRSIKDFEALFYSFNRSIARMEQALTDLEKDPSRILWGGKDNKLPSYNGDMR